VVIETEECVGCGSCVEVGPEVFSRLLQVEEHGGASSIIAEGVTIGIDEPIEINR
jgi:ferredoxin